MKNTLRTLIFFVAVSAGISGCMDKKIERITYTANVPVYMSFSGFRSSFRNTDTFEIKQPGKIYFKDNYLFINEYSKGIHVIDNSNPAKAEKITFYKILGNVDMAIKGNILYADSYIDLQAIEISNVKNPVEVGRLPNIFPEVMPDGGW